MPQTTNYESIITLISNPRLCGYQNTFKTTNDSELYGIYIWAQHAAASLYPLLQNLEISLRNAIDREAKARFGLYWWDQIGKNVQGDTLPKFLVNIDKAKRTLEIERRKKEARRKSPLDPFIQNQWTHDQILAATDFSTWHFILSNDFCSLSPKDNANYLWPKSLGKVFRNYSSITPNSKYARKEIGDLIFELREYRNRLFHHEPVWNKAPNVSDARSAIDTIRMKINKIERLVNSLDKGLLTILYKVGLFDNARRVCSLDELNIYRYTKPYCTMTDAQHSLLDEYCQIADLKNETVIWEYKNNVFGLNKIR
ncbi:Abi family protein [Buttiauxella sp. 3AFRM03]|uniref:Abi family protein n=1 Tax=Buttiauxella sp. 3AFRM03 TaxID=2479367 RepID=UPI001390497E|nr:Abi family protein [Buttiauxella sp. 3AFRM03]